MKNRSQKKFIILKIFLIFIVSFILTQILSSYIKKISSTVYKIDIENNQDQITQKPESSTIDRFDKNLSVFIKIPLKLVRFNYFIDNKIKTKERNTYSILNVQIINGSYYEIKYNSSVMVYNDDFTLENPPIVSWIRSVDIIDLLNNKSAHIDPVNNNYTLFIWPNFLSFTLIWLAISISIYSLLKLINSVIEFIFEKSYIENILDR
jgi:hypothetical protein